MLDPNRLCLGCMNELEEENKICKICGWNSEADENSPHQLKCGTVLQGKYLVGKVLGEGGFGITYLGFNLLLQEKVAIKEFYPHGFVGRDTTVNSTVMSYVGQESFTEKSKDGFIREAKTMQSLNKVEGIVEMKDVFAENNTVYIVMEYVEGKTLKEYVKENGNKLHMSTVLELLEPVMDALEQIHAHNLIHRDISPDNIMVSSDGRVTLLDLGAARQISADGGHSLTVNVKHGYAPMEQYQTHGEQGPWTDIYALCATIYRLITGKVPPNAADRAFEDNIKKPSVLGADISEEQERVLLKGLSVRSSERYLNVFELRDAFILGGENIVEEIIVQEENISAKDKKEAKKEINIKDEIKTKSKSNNEEIIKIAIAVTTIFLIVGISFFSADIIEKNKLEKEYNSAVMLAESGKYEEAIAAFELLGDYNDSKEQIVNCEYLIAESKYQEEFESEKNTIEIVDNISNVIEAKNKNSDVVGWIYIPGLDDVNSAVCQDKETKTYSYNKRNELGEQLNDDEYWIKGAYYTHFRNTFGTGIESLSKNTVIFGHSDMGLTNLSFENDDPTGPRFSQLFSFKDPEFARNTPYFYFSTDEKDYACEIFSVFYNDEKDTKILSSFANYYTGNMGNLWYIEPDPEENEYVTMLEIMKERSIYNYDVEVSGDDRIITLSTNTVGYGLNARARYRFIIVAKIIENQEEATNEFASFKINVNAPIPSTYEEEFKNYITYWDSNVGEEIIVEDNKCGGRIYSAFTDIENGKYRHFLKFELYGTGVHTIKCGERTKTVNLDEYPEGYKGVILWDTVECIVAENGEMSAGEHSGEVFYPKIECEECGWAHETIGSWR